MIAFVASGLINSDAFRRRVMLFNTSSQDYMVLSATVPSGPFVNLHDQIIVHLRLHLLRNLVTPSKARLDVATCGVANATRFFIQWRLNFHAWSPTWSPR